ncbi:MULTISPECIES: hypothetical protein [unclassified Brevundimonas]|uniref:hypothetical protein n=1 Tax=unclassified Brevundimonas TaxID=2622653 RepID=UPI0025BBC387|nr:MULTISPECIES: hypothetical protein [unclassified Brevundimonas]
MTAYTIVITTATEGNENAEVNTLTDEFANESEVIGYSRRLAEELVELAEELQLEFDYSSVGLYKGDVIDEDLTPEHETFLGLWVLDAEGAEYVTAEEFAAEEAGGEEA